MLLRGVLVKLFADRQIAVDEALVSYLLSRMPRELAAARSLVAEIDRRALEERAEVTRNFVGKVLGDIVAPACYGRRRLTIGPAFIVRSHGPTMSLKIQGLRQDLAR